MCNVRRSTLASRTFLGRPDTLNSVKISGLGFVLRPHENMTEFFNTSMVAVDHNAITEVCAAEDCGLERNRSCCSLFIRNPGKTGRAFNLIKRGKGIKTDSMG